MKRSRSLQAAADVGAILWWRAKRRVERSTVRCVGIFGYNAATSKVTSRACAGMAMRLRSIQRITSYVLVIVQPSLRVQGCNKRATTSDIRAVGDRLAGTMGRLA